ncbi:MAG: hypothetical protein NTNFB01_03910 [Nitrospira sp.]
MRDILDVLDVKRGSERKRPHLTGRSSREGQAIRRDELMGIRQQLERQLVMFNGR